MEKKKFAYDTFMAGKNCAQSVLLTFAEELEFDPLLAGQLGSGFGAGIGRLHKSCGAFTGACMIIGKKNSGVFADSSEISERNNDLIQKLESDFSARFGTTDCGGIINTDLRTEEGRKEFSDKNMKEEKCVPCVEFCVEWLEQNL